MISACGRRVGGIDNPAGYFAAAAEGFFLNGLSLGWHTTCSIGTVLYSRRECTQTVENRISVKPHLPTDPVSLGDLCQAMFIEGARVLGYAGEAPMPREVQEQVFLAVTLMADGLGLLLQTDDDPEQELTG